MGDSLSVECHRRGLVTEVVLDSGGDAEHGFVLIRTTRDLYSDGQTFGRTPDRYDSGGRAEQVEPLRVSHGVQILDLPTDHGPLPFAMMEGGNTTDRHEQDGELTHFIE